MVVAATAAVEVVTIVVVGDVMSSDIVADNSGTVSVLTTPASVLEVA